MNNLYKQALADVYEYGIAMGWTHESGVCDLFTTLSNLSELDDLGKLEDDIRPSFVRIWNDMGKLFAIADKFRTVGEL